MRAMDIYEIRTLNLTVWARKYGRNALAEMLGYQDVNYLNQVLSGNTNAGANAPRKWEAKLDLKRGWFDVPHPELWEADGEADPRLQDIIQGWSKLPPEDREVMLALYERLKGRSRDE